MTGFQSKRIMANDKLKGATVKALVRTTIIQEIEIPEDADKQDVLNFLADNQWFGDAFNGNTFFNNKLFCSFGDHVFFSLSGWIDRFKYSSCRFLAAFM